MPYGNICLDRNLIFDFKSSSEYTYPPSKPNGWQRVRICSVSFGCPGGGRKFGDSTDWKITQAGQDGNPDSRGQGF
jgi:hypothetical protein